LFVVFNKILIEFEKKERLVERLFERFEKMRKSKNNKCNLHIRKNYLDDSIQFFPVHLRKKNMSLLSKTEKKKKKKKKKKK